VSPTHQSSVFEGTSREAVTVDGWAVEARSPQLPDLVYLRVERRSEGRRHEFFGYRRYRGDVVTAFGNRGYQYAGFTASIGPVTWIQPNTS
jgi:hypothetical protein